MINISSGNTYYNITKDLNGSLKSLPNLTNQQVYLNCYSKVTVKFAGPVLNETTDKILQTFDTTTTSQTTKHYQMIT